MTVRPVVLCILDGWGHRDATANNAVRLGQTPVFDRLWKDAPRALLKTAAQDVGLPGGQMGNSEVGHQNIGAGRVVLQDLPRIDKAVLQDRLGDISELEQFCGRLKESGGRCHLMGLLSPGGVHSHQKHIVALARLVAASGVPVCVHAFLDGRDTPPRSARGYVADFLGEIVDVPDIVIATLSGRYYPMDRDKRWERVQQAYEAIVDAAGEQAAEPLAAIDAAYAGDISDEFLLPTAIGGYAGIADGDGLLMANFRADRAREILTALVDPAFDGFNRARVAKFTAALGMVSYSEALDHFLPTLFPPVGLGNTLGEVVAAAGLKQLRIAETEKYAHVTFFLNGGEERIFPGEERILVPSPKVATYDLQPEMAAAEVTDELVRAIGGNKFDLIVANYANPDMVGHTGDLGAAIRAVETIDCCLGRLEEAMVSAGGAMLITADHGNVEMMLDVDTGQPHTAHTTNLVPLIVVNPPYPLHVHDGRLADVAPTLLDLIGLEKPREMTGRTLLVRGAARTEPDLQGRASA